MFLLFWKHLPRKHILGIQLWTVLTNLLKKSLWVTNCFWVADRISGFCFPLKVDTSRVYNGAFVQDRLQVNQSIQTLSQGQMWCLAKNFAQENRSGITSGITTQGTVLSSNTAKCHPCCIKSSVVTERS